MSETTKDTSVAIAVLYERLGHVADKLDTLSRKIDRQSEHRDQMIQELEGRVESLEMQMHRARGFVAGLAAVGGLVGGVASNMMNALW